MTIQRRRSLKMTLVDYRHPERFLRSLCAESKGVLRILAFILLPLLVGCSSSPELVTWEYTGGPYAQNISTLHIDKSNPDEMYAGLSNGNIFRSIDQGKSWAKVSTVQANMYAFFPHPNQKDQLYAATEAGLFVSPNRGESWSEMPVDPASHSSCRALAFDPYKPEVMYTGLKGRGISKSIDSGTHWSSINTGLDSGKVAAGEVYTIVIDDASPDVLYAAVTDIGIVKSTDAGQSWTVSQAIPLTGAIATHITLQHGTLCFGTSTGNIFRSTNDGGTWSPTRRGLEDDRILSLTPDPTDSKTLFAGTVHGVFVSNDFGMSWKALTERLPHIPTAIVPSSRNLHVFGQGIGLQRSSDDGATWMHEDVNLGGASISSLAIDNNGSYLYASVGTALYYYKRESASWVPASNGLTGGTITSIAFATDSASTLYLSTTNGVFKTGNRGETWERIARRLWFTDVRFIATHPVINSRLYASGEHGLFISTDKGDSWVQAQPIVNKFNVRSLTFTPTNAGLIHGTTTDGSVISTDNGGFKWESTHYGITSNDVAALTPDYQDNKTFYAWTSSGDGFRSTNNGIVWDRYTPPWNRGDKILITSNRLRPYEVVALVNGSQLYYSMTGGATWLPLSSTPLNAEALTIDWNSKTSTLYAGTKENGVYRLRLQKILNTILGK